MSVKRSTFDVAEYLKTDKDIAIFINEASQTGSDKYIAHCLGIATCAKGMTSIGKKAGLAC